MEATLFNQLVLGSRRKTHVNMQTLSQKYSSHKAWSALITCLATVLALVAASPSPASVHRSCQPAGTQTLAKSSSARVYMRDDGNVYGCFNPTGRKRLLVNVDSIYSSIWNVHIVGKYATYSYFAYPTCKDACPPGITATSHLAVADLITGRQRIANTDPATAVTKLTLSGRGAVAWLTRLADGSSALTKFDADGVRVLDQGLLSKLALARNSRLTWSSNGQAKATMLRGFPRRSA